MPASLKPVFFLVLAGLTAALFVLLAGTPIAQARDEAYRNQLICMLVAGGLGLLYWLAANLRSSVRPANSPLDYLIWLPPIYALFQATPLPIALVRFLSPARASLSDALAPAVAPPSWIPLSLTPSATLLDALLIGCCVIIFLIVYNLACSPGLRFWTAALPLILIGSAEAALGLLQVAFSVNGDDSAIGTFAIRNHYAGLLEMILPFAVVVPFTLLRSIPSPHRFAPGPFLFAGVSWAAAALILVGIIASLSRMGFIAAVSSLALLALIATVRRRAWPLNAAVTISILAGTLAVVVFLSPAHLVNRFGEMASDSAGRESVWHESLGIIRAYPVFGCGLGGFGSAFNSVKISSPTLYQDYAHNDYLQYLAELGVVGFAIFSACLVTVFQRLLRGFRTGGDSQFLAVAGAASTFAIGLHSFVDFNLYVPANRIVFAWVLALSAAAGTRRPSDVKIQGD
jgi:O-antigen ligase